MPAWDLSRLMVLMTVYNESFILLIEQQDEKKIVKNNKIYPENCLLLEIIFGH